MRKHMKFVRKCVVFILIMCISTELVYRIIVPKYFYQEMLPTTLTYTHFYDMEKNTIDVLFLGSSLSSTSYIPQELYNRYGITSYNLGSGKQSPVITYFWLKEALRYQQPQAVVLDCYYLFNYGNTVLNSDEAFVRQALDYMRWSPVKVEAVNTICELDDSYSLSSYYFPNIRYHTRWQNLTEKDFLLSDMRKQYELMGFAPIAGNCNNDTYTPYDPESAEEETNGLPLMKEYLDKILQLCKQNDIALILTNAPVMDTDIRKFYAMSNYADTNNLLFIDFNEETVYKETGYHFAEDNSDNAHTNLWGAIKITDYIGKILKDQYQIAGKYAEQWERTKDSYEDIKKDSRLVRISDINEYVDALKEDRYSVFISTKGNYSAFLSEETISKLRELGFQVSMQTDPSQESFYCYHAAIVDGVIVEYAGYDAFTDSGSFRGSQVTYDIAGDGVIKIANKNKSLGGNGFNIVVYNNMKREVIDSVCFDTSTEKNPVRR